MPLNAIQSGVWTAGEFFPRILTYASFTALIDFLSLILRESFPVKLLRAFLKALFRGLPLMIARSDIYTYGEFVCV